MDHPQEEHSYTTRKATGLIQIKAVPGRRQYPDCP
jgi:hypothetical protein